MSEHDHLIAMLNRLKLTALRDQLDSLIDEAGRRELTIRESLALFCEREIARRDQRRIDMGFGLARFPFVREVAGFDFAAQPSLDKAQIREIASGLFIANGEAVLLLGPPGVGKTHLAVAIGREAIVAGYSVLFSPATTLVAQLAKAHADGRLEERLLHYTKPKLPIVDELVVADAIEIDATEQAFVTALLSHSPKLAQTVALARAFRTMVREQRAGELDEWLLATNGTALAGFASGLKRDLAAVRAALSLPWSTGPVEGQITRLKTIKRTMNGRGGFGIKSHR